MAKRIVRMRAPGEAQGLKQRRHAIRNPFSPAGKSWIFNAGDWVILELNDDEKQFLEEYCNPAGVRLIDVAESEAEAAKIVMARKRQMAAARAKAFPAATLGNEGKIGSDDDILNLVTARAAERNVSEAVVKLEEPDASLVKQAESALAASEEFNVVDPEPEKDTAIDDAIGLLLTVMSHENAQAVADTFGDQLTWVLANEPDRLAEVPGVGKKTVEKFKKTIGA